MAKKKEVHEQDSEVVVTTTNETEIEATEDVVTLDEIKTETPIVIETKKTKKEEEKSVTTETVVTVDTPVITAKNIVEDIQLKTEFEVGDSVKIDDKPYKVVKVRIVKSYDLEDQFGKVERHVAGHLVKDNSVNFAAFVAKKNELQ